MTTRCSLTQDGLIVNPAGVTLGRLVSMEIEWLEQPSRLDPSDVRDMVDCPFCEAPRGEHCRRWRGGERKTNHAERVKKAIEALEADQTAADGATLSERSERYGNSVVSSSCKEKRQRQENQVKEIGPSRPAGAQPTARQREHEAVVRVWEHYQRLIPSRRRLDAKRERIIRNAIAIAGEDHVKKAILGLSRSPWHNGQNDQRRHYLEIRYALRGIGDESDDERIERAISWAVIYAPQTGHANVDPVKVQRWLDDVSYTLSLPHRPSRDRAVVAYRRLQEAGFTVVQLDKAPWARLERG